jgi:hypothetical protein
MRGSPGLDYLIYERLGEAVAFCVHFGKYFQSICSLLPERG